MTQNDFIVYLVISSVLCLGIGLGYNLHGYMHHEHIHKVLREIQS